MVGRICKVAGSGLFVVPLALDLRRGDDQERNQLRVAMAAELVVTNQL